MQIFCQGKQNACNGRRGQTTGAVLFDCNYRFTILFNPNRGPTWKWDMISSVHIIIKKDFKIEFYRKYTSDIHIYKKEDYDSIMEILRENLSREKLKIQH